MNDMDGSGTSQDISSDDVLCISCYKAHQSLITEIETMPEYINDCLYDDIEFWTEIHDKSSTDLLTRAILKTVIFVAEQLYQEKALLLSTAGTIFLEAYTGHRQEDAFSTAVDQLIIDTEDGTVKFTGHWLLHRLIVHLNKYMKFKCIHRKFGTVLYKRDGDILTSLSWALGANKQTYLFQQERRTCQKSDIDSPGTLIPHCGQLFNDLLHNEINRLSKSSTIIDPSDLSIDQFLSEIDSKLTDFLSIATQTAREQHSARRIAESDIVNHSKKVRQFFLLCQLMYCTNPKQSTPMHNLLADIVETCGGSRQLLRILNRLGCVSSPDTHDRFVTMHAEYEHGKKPWDTISPDVFTIASVDNFDMLQSHAAVYHGSHQRSYHGTTVQLVQPSLTFIITPTCNSSVTTYMYSDSQSSVAGASDSTSTSMQQSSAVPGIHTDDDHSDISPPKRRRTVSVRQLQSTCDQQLYINPAPYAEPHHTYGNITIQEFQLVQSEKEEMNILSSSVLSYMLQKVAAAKDNIILQELRQFLKLPHSAVFVKPSQMYYMELINENPDSDETMFHVAEHLLLDTFNNDARQEWVILVGDGKTYQHLMQIKRHYGESLKKLLIFPGDWHTMMNYQSVIMKAYFGAGLEDIAKAAGYRGATLASLQKCSNFKRTHNFILQVWEAFYRVFLVAYSTCHRQEILLHEIGTMLQLNVDKLSTFELMSIVNDIVCKREIENVFLQFIQQQSHVDTTWRFWGNFVFNDCFAYVCLFLSLRSSNWNLRLAALKSMAPIFAAFDRDTYQRIIPNHLADLQTYPLEALKFLKSGGLTVYITGEQWKAVALDEAYEMCINKDLKAAITYPAEAHLQKNYSFF